MFLESFGKPLVVVDERSDFSLTMMTGAAVSM
jgi:hypothetical protein